MILQILAFFCVIITIFKNFIPVQKESSWMWLWIQTIYINITHTEFTMLVKLLRASSLPHPFPPWRRPLLSKLRDSRRGCLCLDLVMMSGGKTWLRLWALRRPRRRRPSIKYLRVQPRSHSYIHPSSWWMTVSHGFLIISKEAKGEQWASSNTGTFSCAGESVSLLLILIFLKG